MGPRKRPADDDEEYVDDGYDYDIPLGGEKKKGKRGTGSRSAPVSSKEIKNWEDILVHVVLSGYVGVSWHECATMRLVSPSVSQRISNSLTVLDARACKRVHEGVVPTSVSLLGAFPSFSRLDRLEMDYLKKEVPASAANAAFSAKDQQEMTKLVGVQWGCLQYLSLRGSVDVISAILLHEIGKQCTSLEVLDVSLPRFPSSLSEEKGFGDSLGNLVNLRFLDLSCTTISDANLEKMLQPMTQLSVLGLSGCRNLTPLALRHVSDHRALTLKVLDISNLNGLTDTVMDNFVHCDFTGKRNERMQVESSSNIRSSAGRNKEGEAWPKLYCLLASFLKDVSGSSILSLLSIKSLRILEMRGQGRLVASEIYDRAKARDIVCLFQHEDVYQDRAACFEDHWPPSMLAFRPPI